MLYIVLGLILSGLAVYSGLQLYQQHQRNLILDQVDQLLINAAKSGLSHLNEPVERGGCGGDLSILLSRQNDLSWIPDGSALSDIIFVDDNNFKKGLDIQIDLTNNEFRFRAYLADKTELRTIMVNPATSEMQITSITLPEDIFQD